MPKIRENPEYRSVKLEKELARKAKYIADLKDMTIGEYMTLITRPTIERDFTELVKG